MKKTAIRIKNNSIKNLNITNNRFLGYQNPMDISQNRIETLDIHSNILVKNIRKIPLNELNKIFPLIEEQRAQLSENNAVKIKEFFKRHGISLTINILMNLKNIIWLLDQLKFILNK